MDFDDVSEALEKAFSGHSIAVFLRVGDDRQLLMSAVFSGFFRARDGALALRFDEIEGALTLHQALFREASWLPRTAGTEPGAVHPLHIVMDGFDIELHRADLG